MLVIPASDALWTAAEHRAAGMPIYAGSHRGRFANQVGALGEIMFESFLESRRIPFERVYETGCDLRLFGATLEVKTKDRTVPPQMYFECSVPLYNHDHQRPTFYVFVSLFRDRYDNSTAITRFKRGHVLGWATLRDVDEKGVHRKANETDPANGTTFWTDCLNLRIDQLRPIGQILDACTRRMNP